MDYEPSYNFKFLILSNKKMWCVALFGIIRTI